MFVDYSQSILSYIASLRGYYGLESSVKSNKRLDTHLAKKKPKQIFTILVDGMGYNLLTRALSEDSFLLTHLFEKTLTVYPPTTVAATTSILNGKTPNENGWIGWAQYLKEVDDTVVLFREKSFYSDNSYPGIASKAIPVSNIIDELNAAHHPARLLFPAFKEDGCDSFPEMCRRLSQYSKTKEYEYIYAYWDGYDSYNHLYGPSDPYSALYLKHINECLELLHKEVNEDTLVMVIADHGQIDISKHINLYPEYEEYFDHAPALEQRTMAFYVKEEKKKEFEKKFKHDFEDQFILLTHEQVLQSELFGPGNNHPRFEEFIGDYLALAKTKACLNYLKEGKPKQKGQHAGTMEDEMMVPVIIF